MKTQQELEAEKIDLGSRLYYCTDSPSGKKMRREIEKRIKLIDKTLDSNRGSNSF